MGKLLWLEPGVLPWDPPIDAPAVMAVPTTLRFGAVIASTTKLRTVGSLAVLEAARLSSVDRVWNCCDWSCRLLARATDQAVARSSA